MLTWTLGSEAVHNSSIIVAVLQANGWTTSLAIKQQFCVQFQPTAALIHSLSSNILRA